jgi:hypothetical protein
MWADSAFCFLLHYANTSDQPLITEITVNLCVPCTGYETFFPSLRRFDPILGHDLPLWCFAITLIGHTTLRRTTLDEWSSRRRDLYLTTHSNHKRKTSMPPTVFDPTITTSEQPLTQAIDRAATGICVYNIPEVGRRKNTSLTSHPACSGTPIIRLNWTTIKQARRLAVDRMIASCLRGGNTHPIK